MPLRVTQAALDRVKQLVRGFSLLFDVTTATLRSFRDRLCRCAESGSPVTDSLVSG